MAYSKARSRSDAAQVSRDEYEVFLSFRRLDARNGFIDSLYQGLMDAGVRIFKDDEESSVGEVIDGNLLRAINNSVLYIPIFSQTYAFSKWCLRELALIVDNVSMSEGQKSILPIFLDMEPEDIMLKTPLYSNALLEHKKEFPLEVEAWRVALAKVGEIKGWNWKKDQSEAVIIKSVVEKVLEKLEIKPKLVNEHLVGLDGQIEELIKLLDVDNPNVRFIVIYGMDGIGKTTVAKAVFDELSSHFGKCCSFIENVRESSSTKEGIVQLQKKLLYDIVGFEFVEKVDDSEERMRRIGETLRTKKVLVVLDDVGGKGQIKNLIGDYPLHPGSRIIITTRDKSTLPVERFNDDIVGYEILKMDDALALQFFCQHAFDRDFPSNDYQELSSEIVSTTGQLPLTIEVIGSLLKWKDKAFWKETLVRLKNLPEEEILKKLKISYDGLNDSEKQIFLDIACFFFKEKKTDAIYMWDSCQFYPTNGIKVLTERCLIKVLDNGKFWMHDQLLALGRQIVREESRGNLEKQSRLWIAKEALEIIRTKESKDEVQALDIDGLDDFVEITNEEFERLQNLRLLKLRNGTYTGDFAKCHLNLRWISWHSPHLDFRADNMHWDYLVVFKLDKSGFTDHSKAWDLIKGARNLKVLSLTECHGITTTPDFSKCLGLERLTLAGCCRLKRIESFIGYLPSLIELEIKRCKGLTILPEEVGALGKLERFSLWGCSGLRELPSSIRNLTSLTELDLTGTLIKEIPNSIAKLPSGINTLVNLEELDLSGHDEMKGEIPIEIEELSSLRILNLESAGIGGIRRLTNMLCHLQTLNIWDSSTIQEFLELPTSLTHQHLISESSFSILNLLNLTNLVELLLSTIFRSGKKLQIFTSLKKLNLLNVLAPLDFASHFHLEELDFRHLDPKPLVQLLSSYCSWRNLSTLEFYQCDVEAIPLERLPQLKKLTVDGCLQLKRLFIPLELRKLNRVWVSRCPELVEIQIGGHSKSLEFLRFSRCKSLIRIGGLSNLKYLEELEIQRCNVLTNIEGFHELESLKSLVVKKCTSLRRLTSASWTNIPADCLIELWECGDFIKQGDTSLKRYREEILLDTSNKRMRKMEDEAREQAANMETSYRNYAIAAVQNVVGIDDHVEEITDNSLEMEVDDESMEEKKDDARQQAADMETSERIYAIAAVQNVVGIDDRAKQMTDLLEMEVNDEVRIFGIYGTHGIGKTTLAKAVYKRISSCFDSCSFLAEVEETTQNPCGIQFLQNKLIRDILERDRENPSFDERIEDFLDIFREMKVLIVVDDVEEQSHLHAIVGDQLHWFGPGSRIIVTSKNSGILQGYDLEKARNYMVSELDDGQAFELFCKHAFRMQSSIPDYDGFSNRIVDATEKLPLTVEVVGSFLRGKSIQEWKKMEKSMKERMMISQKTTVGLEEILDICYKELGQQQKDIFLDIACFISGMDAQIASYMWPNCYPSSGCILMPLAKIGENNELQMHRLLRCLGKRIFKQEGSGDPSSRRFCTEDMVLKAMNREKGIENVEGRDSCILTAASLTSMPAISFLKLDDAKVSGDFAGAFPSLRWLCWQRCPLEFDAINFVLRELVILDLSWSKITEDWGGWTEIKMEKLKVLNLTGCSDLLITPNFSDYKDLEILILERCSHLGKLDPSIGHLKRLVCLNLKFCSQLNGLPVELGCTTALKELFIDGTSVRQIPISIGNLKQLEILSGFKCFPLTHLPSSICYLISLSELSLDGAKISELPSSLVELLKLRRLSLRDCRYLGKLPYSIGEMGSLEELDISATSISELPDSIKNLKSLKVLRMDSSFVRAFPREIGNLTKLEELHASSCRSLKGAIPGDIVGLHCLRSLTLGHSSISSLPPEISAISGLHTLDLIQCNEIEELPKLPPSLIRLRVSSKRMKVILLENLKKLEELCLSDGEPKARRPPFAIGEIEGLEGLKALKRLDISNCKIRNLNGIGQLTWLSSLILSDCDDLSSLDLSSLKSLKVLEIRRCKMIHEIEGIDNLTSLKKLHISECPAKNSVQAQNALKDVRARSTVT